VYHIYIYIYMAAVLDHEPVFFQDPSILFRDGRAFDLAPYAGDSYAGQINSSARFIIYVLTLVLSYAIDPFLLAMVVCAAIFFYVRHQNNLGASGKRSVGVVPEVAPTCQEPTPENPFGNFLMNEYEERPNRPPGCDPALVKDEIDAQFYHNLYRDATDLYENQNSQRQFFRMPVTEVCNDQRGFASFCFSEMGARKAQGIR
jgi:hypothetical protein